jgi:hypothetical protein
MANKPLAQDMEALEEGPMDPNDPYNDPQFNAVKGSEPASPQQDRQMAGHLADALEFIYSDKGLPAITRGLKSDLPLYESVPKLTKVILEKTLANMKEANAVDSAIFFGEGGLLQQIPQELFGLAQTLGVQGADDQDQISAALMGTYKMAGEHLLEQGDEESLIEAQALGAEMLLTQPDGSIGSPVQMQRSPEEGAKQPVNLLGV